jgi:transcriptional regulator with GAF, ATPase, and Fis domain
MLNNGKAVAFENTIVTHNESLPANGSQSAAVTENRLEALRVLSNSILREVESLKRSADAVLPGKIDLSEEVERFEKDLIRCALLRTGGKQRQAARLLNVKFTTLSAKIKRYGITTNDLNREN